MDNKPIYITDFTGQAENPNTGAGVYVGIDLYTTKTVARLSRKMNKQTGTLVTALPVYDCIDNNGYIYVQDEAGQIYKSVDNGVIWTVLGGRTNPIGTGKGIVAFRDTNSTLASRKDYLFAFNPDSIDLYNITTNTWTQNWWTTTASQPALQNAVGINHMPFTYGQVIYFCNGNYIGLFQQFVDVVFNPTDTSTYIASPSKFTLDAAYISTTIGFLPPNQFGIAVRNITNPSQANIVIWDGVQIATYTNLVTLPGASNPVMQMATKNGVMYAVTDQEHGIYIVNGSSAQLVDRLALRMSNRTAGGAQVTTRVASNIYPSAIDFQGPELLTGGSNSPSPVSQISGTGLYPFGVWSVNIEPNPFSQGPDTGSSGVIGLRYPLSFGDINAQYTTAYTIGFIRSLSNNLVLVGWSKGSTYGIDLLDSQNYITDSNTVFLESSLYLAGTRLNPRTFNTFEFNLVAPLNTGEEIQFYWRSNLAMDYQTFDTPFTATRLNGELAGTIQTLPFQKVKYIQIAARIKSGSTNNLTPQLRDALLK